MEAETSGNPGREPRRSGITLADLMVLTLGVAVAAALDWYSLSAAPARFGGSSAPTWYVVANRATEVCQKGCIALSVLILFQRWRSGGGLRPAEALPMFVALPPVAFSLSKWHGFGIYYLTHPGKPWSVSAHLDALHCWIMAQAALGLAALVLAHRLHRRIPGWAVGALIVVAYSRLVEPLEYFYRDWANRRFTASDLSPTAVMLAYSVLVEFPIAVLRQLPLAAAAVDFGRGDRPRRSWSEWSGMLLGAAIYLLVLARALTVRSTVGSTFGPLWRMIAIEVVALSGGVLLVRRFGSRLCRQSGPIGDEPG